MQKLRDDYIAWIKSIRKSKKLHSVIEQRLIDIVGMVAPDYHPIKEPVGLAGGRNDLLLFAFDKTKVLFEIFASKGQVSRDLRILDKTVADKKIAVIIDKEVDAQVFNRFLRENPEDNYPFIFIGELYAERLSVCLLKLRELILGDEEAKFQRMLQARIPKSDFLSICREQGIEVLTQEDIGAANITFSRVFLTVVLSKLRRLGIQREKVLELGRWLSLEGCIAWILTRVNIGLNVFLYTDFEGNMAAYADIDLIDWIRAGHEMPQPFVILSLNAVVHEIEETFLKKKKVGSHGDDIKITVGFSQIHETDEGRYVTFGIPSNTKSIEVLAGSVDGQDEREKKDQVLKMMNFHFPDAKVHIIDIPRQDEP